MKHNEEDDDFEDLIVFVVDKNISKEKKLLLKTRALRLEHQDNIDKILKNLCNIEGNIRTVGFPQVSKEIDFDTKQARIQPRGFYGKKMILIDINLNNLVGKKVNIMVLVDLQY